MLMGSAICLCSLLSVVYIHAVLRGRLARQAIEERGRSSRAYGKQQQQQVAGLLDDEEVDIYTFSSEWVMSVEEDRE